MAIEATLLPPGTRVDLRDGEDLIFARMYQPTGYRGRKSTIVIPDSARKISFLACVETVGPGRTVDVGEHGVPIRLPMRYRQGDRILFSRYHGEQLEIEGFLYILLRQDDVLARLEVPQEFEALYEWAGLESDTAQAVAEARIIED